MNRADIISNAFRGRPPISTHREISEAMVQDGLKTRARMAALGMREAGCEPSRNAAADERNESTHLSRVATIKALAREGKMRAEIAADMGISLHWLKRIISKARARGEM